MRHTLLCLLVFLTACAVPDEVPAPEPPATGDDDDSAVVGDDDDSAVVGDDDDSAAVGDDDDSTEPEPAPVALLPTNMSDQITMDIVPIPEDSPGGFASYGTFEVGSLNPRSFHAPLDDGRIWAGWNAVSGTGYVGRIDGVAIDLEVTFPDRQVHGVVAIEDGGFGVLLRGDDVADTEGSPLNMWLSRHDSSGAPLWMTQLTSGALIPQHNSGNNVLGDSRLAYGNGRFVAYYTVYDEGSGHHRVNPERLQ